MSKRWYLSAFLYWQYRECIKAPFSIQPGFLNLIATFHKKAERRTLNERQN